MSEHLYLPQAMLCINCEAIFSAGPDACPSCTGKCFLLLCTLVEPVRTEMDTLAAIGRAKAYMGVA
jgi:hypothetical protein